MVGLVCVDPGKEVPVSTFAKVFRTLCILCMESVCTEDARERERYGMVDGEGKDKRGATAMSHEQTDYASRCGHHP